MSIPLEQPPRSMDAETQNWVMRMFTLVAAEIERLDAEKKTLEARVKALEPKP